MVIKDKNIDENMDKEWEKLKFEEKNEEDEYENNNNDEIIKRNFSIRWWKALIKEIFKQF